MLGPMARATLREIRRAAAEALGPSAIPAADLVAAPPESGLDLGPEPTAPLVEALLGRAAFVELSGRRWLALDRALDETRWATIADAGLVADDALGTEPDLELIAICALE